jgi:hypothetical protein
MYIKLYVIIYNFIHIKYDMDYLIFYSILHIIYLVSLCIGEMHILIFIFYLHFINNFISNDIVIVIIVSSWNIYNF